MSQRSVKVKTTDLEYSNITEVASGIFINLIDCLFFVVVLFFNSYLLLS